MGLRAPFPVLARLAYRGCFVAALVAGCSHAATKSTSAAGSGGASASEASSTTGPGSGPGGNPGSTSSTSGPGPSGGSGGSACGGYAISPTPQSFALPGGFLSDAGAPPFSDLPQASCADAPDAPNYTLLDVNGDGRLDLVLLSSSTDATIGTTKWLAFLGGPTGFSQTPTDFALPSGYMVVGSPTFPALSKWLVCDNGSNGPAYEVLDVTGDGLPDMVVTASCNDASVGASKWIVYKGTGTGFAQASSDFALPPGYGTGGAAPPFAGGGNQNPTACLGQGVSAPVFQVTDMNGDGKPDLVVTQTCYQGCGACTDTGVGTTKWLLHAGDGSGFAQTATDLALPAGYTAAIPPFDVFSNPAPKAACSSQENLPPYFVFDLNGDGKRDLVISGSCSDTTVGTTKWILYAGTASGFSSTPSDFALPPGYGPGPFGGLPFSTLESGMAIGSSTGMNAACTNGANVPGYIVTDLDGDHTPDFVVTQACNDATVGASRWLVYAGTASGFSQTPSDLALPPGYASGSAAPAFATFQNPACVFSCSGGQGTPDYALVDLTAKGQLAMVVTRSCADSSVGSTKWLLYPGACMK